jgi:hypothetical protein
MKSTKERAKIDRLKRELMLALMRAPAKNLTDSEADILYRLMNEKPPRTELEIAVANQPRG